MWKTQNPYMIFASTGIHGPGFHASGIWKYHWYGFLDQENVAKQLVNATNNWKSYNDKEKSDVASTLGIIFFEIFNPCLDKDSWIEDDLIIEHVFPKKNLIIARFKEKKTSVRFYFTPGQVRHYRTEVKIEIGATRTRFENTTPSPHFSIIEEGL